jgi:hypothetical protein
MRLLQELIDFFKDMYILLIAIASAWQCGKPYRIECRSKAKEWYYKYILTRWWKENRSFNNFVYQLHAFYYEKENYMHVVAQQVEKDKNLMYQVNIILTMAGLRVDNKEVCKKVQQQLHKEGFTALSIIVAVIAIAVMWIL